MNVIKMLPLFFLTCAAQASITDQLKPESFFDTFFHDLSFHHDVKTVNGDTLKYQPQPDDYNFSTPITSSLLMVDITPSLFIWHQFSAYPVLGLGIARNTLFYYGTTRSTNNSLGANTHIYPGFDLGIGERIAVTTNLSTSLEYLYTNAGKGSPDNISSGNIPLSSTEKYKLSNQSALFGLIWKL